MSNDPVEWAGDFALTSEYCYAESGRASRSFVEEDRRKLVVKYPYRSYQMKGDPTFETNSDGTISLDLAYSYKYSGSKTASGSCDVSMRLQRGSSGWSIIKYEESVRRK